MTEYPSEEISESNEKVRLIFNTMLTVTIWISRDGFHGNNNAEMYIVMIKTVI